MGREVVISVEVFAAGILTVACTVFVAVSVVVVVVVVVSTAVTVLFPTGAVDKVHSHSRAWASPAIAGRVRMTSERISIVLRVVIVAVGKSCVELVQAGF